MIQSLGTKQFGLVDGGHVSRDDRSGSAVADAGCLPHRTGSTGILQTGMARKINAISRRAPSRVGWTGRRSGRCWCLKVISLASPNSNYPKGEIVMAYNKPIHRKEHVWLQ